MTNHSVYDAGDEADNELENEDDHSPPKYMENVNKSRVPSVTSAKMVNGDGASTDDRLGNLAESDKTTSGNNDANEKEAIRASLEEKQIDDVWQKVRRKSKPQTKVKVSRFKSFLLNSFYFIFIFYFNVYI